MIAVITKFCSVMGRYIEDLLSIMLVLMTAFIFIQVLCRFVFHVAAPWTEEAARYLFVWICIVGSGIAISRGAHLGIDVFVNILPPEGQRACRILSHVLCLALFTVMIIYSVETVQVAHRQLSAAMEIPMSVPYSALFVGSILMFVQTVGLLWTTLFGEREEGNL